MADLVEVPDPQPAASAPAADSAPKADAAPAKSADGQGKVEVKPAFKQLKPHLQTNEIVNRHNDFNDMAEALVAWEGKKDRLLETPASDASDEVKAQFRAKLTEAGWIPKGVEKAEDYQVAVPKLPEGVKWNPDAEKEFRAIAVKARLSNEQLNLLIEYDTQRTLARDAQNQQAVKAAAEAQAALDRKYRSALESDWGAKFNENQATAKAALEKAASPELREILSKAKLPGGGSAMDHPLLAKFFFDLSSAIGETGFIGGKSTSNQPQARGFLSPAERQGLIDDGLIKP